MTSEPEPTARPLPDTPPQVRVAGAVVALQGLVGIVFGVVLLVRGLGADVGIRYVLGETGYFVVIGAACVATGIGLLRGRRWARSPAIVVELLLLPVVYSLLGPSKQIVWGIVVGVVVIATFLLLISERSRMWALDLHDRSTR
ncbi:membrane protein [Pseudonocardia sulfidoxydans NBRC 16205]|uniref:Membrane protein n=1 Tax=Pseudonocardia sulfidoxydans NBRC 16205 TaxID=1223511 RepID=A0A511DLJ7_9PSEU|nr:hypothetical protein [Pseudonocardia sulfidoxydans]GEL25690.1 membrane protein [Pseudonocardia sulfidoxydans NBRC 16205]